MSATEYEWSNYPADAVRKLIDLRQRLAAAEARAERAERERDANEAALAERLEECIALAAERDAALTRLALYVRDEEAPHE